MDATAKADCETLVAILAQNNIGAIVVGDASPGVPQGTFEVRVPAHHAARAEKLVAENPLPDDVEEVDPSSKLDLETVFRADGGELQALTIKGLLESNGIATVLVGDAVLPNLAFELKVARDKAETARQLIAEVESQRSDESDS